LKLSAFKVENYRSLKQVSLENMAELNVLIGKNSSGKSNLLEAMNMFFSEFEPVKGATPGLNEYIWHKGSTGPVVFEATFEVTGDQLTGLPAEDQAFLTSVFGKTVPSILKITRSLTNAQGVWKTDSIVWGIIVMVKDDVPQLSPNLKIDSPTLERILKIVSQMIKSRFRLLGASRDVRGGDRFRTTVLDENAQTSLWNLQQSTSLRDEEKYVEVETAFSEVTSLRLDPAQARLMVRKGSRRFPLGLEGGGTQGAANVLFASLVETDDFTILGIEEPGIHGHPRLQRRLCREIERIARRRQVLISTHSPTVVDALPNASTWMVEFEDGQTRVAQADDLRRLLRELGSRPSDALFSDRIVVVEGMPDRMVLEAFARRLGIDLADVAFVTTRGRGSETPAKTLEALVSAAGGALIPAFVILDADRSAEASRLVEAKLIPKQQVHVWKAGSIESYYPADVLRDALQAISTRYSLNLNVNKYVQEFQSGKLSPNRIDIGDKARRLDSSWEMTLAEEVAARLERSQSDPPTEIRDTLAAIGTAQTTTSSSSSGPTSA